MSELPDPLLLILGLALLGLVPFLAVMATSFVKIAVILSLVYCGLFIYGSWVYLKKMKMIGIPLEDIDIPTWIAHSILLIGLVFLSIRLLILLWRVAVGRATGFLKVDEAEESMHLAEELSENIDAQGGRGQ